MLKFWLKTGLACLALLLLAAGCGDVDSRSRKAIKQFGPAMDAKRIELKLLPIPKDADLNLLGETSLAWMAKDQNACHASKTIVYNQDVSALVSEVDVIHSPGYYSASSEGESANGKPKKSNSAGLTITTTFSPDGQSISQQVFTLTRQGEKAIQPKAQDVEKLLTDWGVR
jgi:hypothetical protein